MRLQQYGRQRQVTIPVVLSYDLYTKVSKEQLDISSFLETALRKYYKQSLQISERNTIKENCAIAVKQGISLDDSFIDYLVGIYNVDTDRDKVEKIVRRFNNGNRKVSSHTESKQP